MIHIIYTYKGKVYDAMKDWTCSHAEAVLKRLGATYWEIGILKLTRDERTWNNKGRVAV